MTLLALISGNALSQANGNNWDQVAEILNGLTKEVIDSRSWTYANIGQRLGSDVQLAVSRFMATQAQSDLDLNMAHQLLLLGDGEKTGLRLDEESRQTKLQGLIDVVPDPQVKAILSAVKSLGRRVVPLLDAPVTADECQTTWEREVRTQRNGNLKSRFDSILNQIGTSEHSEGISALRAMADELEVL